MSSVTSAMKIPLLDVSHLELGPPPAAAAAEEFAAPPEVEPPPRYDNPLPAYPEASAPSSSSSATSRGNPLTAIRRLMSTTSIEPAAPPVEASKSRSRKKRIAPVVRETVVSAEQIHKGRDLVEAVIRTWEAINVKRGMNGPAKYKKKQASLVQLVKDLGKLLNVDEKSLAQAEYAVNNEKGLRDRISGAYKKAPVMKDFLVRLGDHHKENPWSKFKSYR